MPSITKKRKTTAGLKITVANTVLADIPVDVLAEILMRLPVQSLLMFKRVCKSWYSLIKSPAFVDMHLKHATLIEDSHSAILKRCLRNSSRTHVSYLPDKKDATTTAHLSVDVPRPILFFGDLDDELGYRSRIMFKGSCNGIICVSGYHRKDIHSYRQGDLIALWNPATRETKLLPLSCVPRGDTPMAGSMSIGFGFDLKSKDYKVVRVLDYDDGSRAQQPDPSTVIDPTLWLHPLVEVYSLSTNCWRKIDVEVPTMQMCYSGSAYLDGFYYWWSSRLDRRIGNMEYKVLTFDFANEVFNTIDPPYLVNPSIVTLVNYKDSIALFSEDYQHSDFMALWVLSRDENKDSWFKLFQVPNQDIDPVGCFRNGHFLEVHDYVDDEGESYFKLQQYDPSRGKQVVGSKTFDGVKYDVCAELVNYVQSLVSFC